MQAIQAPSGDNLAEWSAYLDQWEAARCETLDAYNKTGYSKARAIGMVNARIKAQTHERLTRKQILGLTDLLSESKQEMVFRRTFPNQPGMIEMHSLTRPTEMAAIAHVVFSVVNGDRDAVIDAPYGMLWCVECANFLPFHKFHIEPSRPRGYADRCRDCINEGYEWLRVA